MKVIETIYKGYKFRSRTEARWAVFFDAIGIEYKYELEGFQLPSGNYLPDFYLPNFEDGMGVYAEIKGESFTEAEKLKCLHLAEFSHKNVLMLDGSPDYKSYDYYLVYKNHAQDNCPLNCEKEVLDFGEMHKCKLKECSAPYEFKTELVDGIICSRVSKYNERMFILPGFKTFEPANWYDYYRNGIEASRSARFEHGQSGSTI